jgi:hypothetical protein
LSVEDEEPTVSLLADDAAVEFALFFSDDDIEGTDPTG